MDYNKILTIKHALIKSRLIDFINYMERGYIAGWFHQELCAKMQRFLDDVLAGNSPRLIVSVPPRHGKSTIVSKYFPAWVFGKHPNFSIISTSYAASLASRFTREVQRVLDSDSYKKIFPTVKLAVRGRDVESRTSDYFELVGYSGSYRSAGVGGGITGLGCDILVCDDLVKGVEDAHSPQQRDAVWEWFRSVAYTRLNRGGGIIVVMTRWHYDDIAGRLISGGGDTWDVVLYPAIAEHDEIHRQAGEALHSERFPIETLHKIREAIGTTQFMSLYQQSPVAAGGNILKLDWFVRYDDAPKAFSKITFSIDTAYKATQISDYSVIQVWGTTSVGNFLLDVWRKQAIMPDLIRAVQEYAGKYKPHEILIEDAASGQSLIQTLKTTTKLPIIPVKVTTDKITRIYAEATAIEAGRVLIPRYAQWVPALEQEILTFPKAKHDDQIDALSQYLKRQRESFKLYELHHVGGGGAQDFWR